MFAALFYFTTFVAKHVSTHDDDAANCSCSSAVARSRDVTRSRDEGGVCRCVDDLLEVRCDGLTDVPQFSNTSCVLAGVYMANQSIRRLGADAFTNVPTRRLVLNFNDIDDRIDAAAFRGNLSELLRELYLGACRLRILPVGLLDNMNSLVFLHLWHNRLTRIPTGLFTSCCGDLQELLLSHNSIASLDSRTFTRLQSLRKLDLDFNEISALSRQVFNGLDNLRVIYFCTLLMHFCTLLLIE